ncbi:MAG TPA: beta-ketoacyl synthase N-terminal-like domain-containing protein, partial [Xanthobacteraceae bacterium]|nr:beta-ketoacyl synthase N-terminal-like domain-containing protein [Xanthobacteraceae bacterium]
MTDAFIYDHVRTPRGRGKADGALHEVTALALATQALATLRQRNRLDAALVDDVVLGCVDPVGEAGGDIARVAALCAGYGNGVPGVQINRFCASGLDAVNFAAAEVMSGQHDMTVGGGVESMSRVGIGASGGAWPVDPSIAIPSYFMPQGVSADLIATKYGFSRDDVVLGCVDPVGEAGGDIARAAALCADFGDRVPGVQINRFCASGLDAVNFAAAQIMAGQHDLAIGGGVESMSRVGIGASGGAWPVDPAIAIKAYFMPQGVSADLIATKYGFSRDDVDAYAVESQRRAAKAWNEGRFAKSVAPVKDVNGITLLAKDEHMRPATDMQSLAALKPSF